MKTINTPDDWSQVTLSQFVELSQLDVKDKNHSVMVASILTDVDSEEIKKYDTESFNRIMSALSWTNTLPDEAKFKKIITIDGVDYGLINKFSELSTGNWIDIEEYLKDYPKNIHKVLSILYRPLITAINDDYRVIEEYDTVSGEHRANLFFDKVCVQDVHGAVLFFCLIGNLSIKNMKTYLEGQLQEKEMKEQMRKKPKMQRLISGVGSAIFTRSQKEILRKLKMSLN